ncbi:nitrilase-related carbon-nitrogen hydrolase, partial [Streptomyces californicus]|uniref:nitrilase-related carbon-nitrogen hydrolase n=1 Tax=Streptomyces californicus TaxID=67351 RepID=UPI0036AA8F0A
MPQLRLALNQIDSTVGDLAGNSEAIVHWTRHAAEQGAHLVAFPEMALTGYPVEDLALRSSVGESTRQARRGLGPRRDAVGVGEMAGVGGELGR